MRIGLSKARASLERWLAAAGFQARRCGGDAGGTTAVEFALVAPLVIALILGGMQIAVISFARPNSRMRPSRPSVSC